MKKSILGVMVLAAVSLAVMSLMVTSVLAADVSRGQFYTEEEYQKLGKKELAMTSWRQAAGGTLSIVRQQALERMNHCQP